MFSKKALLAGIYFICLVVYFLATKNTDEKGVDAPQLACQDFQSSCDVMIGEQAYTISFDRKTLIPEEPFSIVIEPSNVSSIPLPQLSGFMEGVTMYMGKVPLVFEQALDINSEHTKHIFKATTVLGSCNENKMTWRIWLGESKAVSEIIIDAEQLMNKAYIDVVIKT